MVRPLQRVIDPNLGAHYTWNRRIYMKWKEICWFWGWNWYLLLGFGGLTRARGSRMRLISPIKGAPRRSREGFSISITPIRPCLVLKMKNPSLLETRVPTLEPPLVNSFRESRLPYRQTPRTSLQIFIQKFFFEKNYASLLAYGKITGNRVSFSHLQRSNSSLIDL